jgi:hypothetical protein
VSSIGGASRCSSRGADAEPVLAALRACKRQLQRLRSIAKQLEDKFFAPLAAEERGTFHHMLFRLASEHDPRFGVAPSVSSKPD